MTDLPVDPIRSALLREFDRITALLDELPDDAWHTPTRLPGWDVQAVVAHLVGTESMLAGRSAPAGPESDGTADHVRNPIGEFNERWVVALAERSPAAMRTAWREITGERRAALAAATQEDFDRPAETPAGPATYGRFMRIRLFDLWMHELDIRAATDRAVPYDAETAGLASTEIVGAAPFVVGKRGKAPAGSHIRFVFDGPLVDPVPRTLEIVVTDRARAVENPDSTPTVTLTLPFPVFVELAGGRAGVDDHRDDIRVEGDSALGEQILTHLAFVI